MPSIICIGSVLIDELFFCNEEVIMGTSNPAHSKINIGGVMSNIAQHLSLLGNDVELIAVLGNDKDADWVKTSFSSIGLKTNHAISVHENTGKYISILNPDGSLYTAACADQCSKYLTPEFLQSKSEFLISGELIVADTNLEIITLEWLIQFALKNNKKLFIEPVSVAKARKLSALNLNGVYMITPNKDELISIINKEERGEQEMIVELLNRGVENIWLRKEALGSQMFDKNGSLSLSVPEIKIIDSTGAGDAALAGWITAYIDNLPVIDCLKNGHTMAMETLQVEGAVNYNITKEKLISASRKYYHD